MVRIPKTVGCVLVVVMLACARLAEPAEPTPEQRQEMEKKAAALNQKVLEHHARGEFLAGTKVAEEALELRRLLYPREKCPQGHPNLAQSLHNLAALLDAQGQYAKAEPVYREALTMRQALYPKDKYPRGHLDLASTLNNLGNCRERTPRRSRSAAMPWRCIALCIPRMSIRRDTRSWPRA